ncbi:Tubulin polyglutamylase TTLL6 [Halotydeus destructor]|nr:Tubulin polyglutamylase TTLL6 [Halotydeus destructor]
MNEIRRRIAKKESSEASGSSRSVSNEPAMKVVKESSSNDIRILVILFGVLAILIGAANYRKLDEISTLQNTIIEELVSEATESPLDDSYAANKPRVWIQGKKLEAGYLRHVFDVFERLGYRIVNGTEEPWDVLWAHDYPFTPAILNSQVLPHQRVNHFPGSGFITNKVSLATSGLKHIPKAFHLPKEKVAFVKYTEEHPDKLWVRKNNEHRGIKIEDLKTLDMEVQGNFVQEFVQNPYLIDGRKFDIGLYVTMTSVNPLRVYIYDDAIFRFCAYDYYPFNATNVESYVVGDDYTPMWEIPSIRKYFVDSNMNMKRAFDAYMRSVGKDVDGMWSRIEDSIRSVYLAKHGVMDKVVHAYGNNRNFFEMVRFDFVVDEELNIYLMEANMSPNLSSIHFAPNQLLYEQVIFNILSLSGLSSSFNIRNWSNKGRDVVNMMVSDKDLSVYEEICSSDDCHLSCKEPKCKVCSYCLDPSTKLNLKDAYVEHQHRYNNKRLIPTVKASSQVAPGVQNDLQHVWFAGMCMKSVAWCS